MNNRKERKLLVETGRELLEKISSQNTGQYQLPGGR